MNTKNKYIYIELPRKFTLILIGLKVKILKNDIRWNTGFLNFEIEEELSNALY